MSQIELFSRFGVALFIGFLIGLQREYSHGGPKREIFAGARTFALLGLVGCLAAFIADILNNHWVFLTVILVVGALIALAYALNVSRGQVGQTTEVAALVTVMAGALCYWDYLALAVAIGVTTVVLLSLKLEMQTLVTRITPEDIYATLKLAVITAIVLPVLPNQTFGIPPFDTLNPYKIWLMVVLISGISFMGYILNKVVGTQYGIGLTGLLGGLASSTAVTVSFSQRSKQVKTFAKTFALGITVSWTMMFLRIMVVVAAINVTLLSALWPPLVVSAIAGFIYSAYLYLSQKSDQKSEVVLANPFSLSPALKFGLFYVIILLVSGVALTVLGDLGLYLSSVFAGLADVDAITLSVSDLTRLPASLDLAVGSRAIVLAAMSNTLVKGGIVLLTGSAGLKKAALPGLFLIFASGVSVAFLV